MSNLPRPITVFLPDSEDLDALTDEFKEILCDSKIANKKICIISIAGKFRTGKSFLLNIFLRYLVHLENGGLPEDRTWLTNGTKLPGFSWRSGESPDTTGIVVWSHPFILKDKNGEELAVLLMDTQGSFDNNSTFKECACVFALSILISSLQIYNLFGNIDSSDLGHLLYFTNYGNLAMTYQEEFKPFQSLLFLVREWYLNENYGFTGGQLILDSRLNNVNQSEELRNLRRGIDSSFEDLDCFLLPSPGSKIRRISQENANIGELEPIFVDQLYSLVSFIFSPENLILKQINGEAITCKQLYNYFEAYVKIFNGNSLPEPQYFLSSQAEIINLHAYEKALDLYVEEMQKFVKSEEPTDNILLTKEHNLASEKAKKCFRDAKRMGSEKIQVYSDKLAEKIENAFKDICNSNIIKQEKMAEEAQKTFNASIEKNEARIRELENTNREHENKNRQHEENFKLLSMRLERAERNNSCSIM